MKKILVIDGQGGGIGKALIVQLRKMLPEQEVIALGTNALATAGMLRAGATNGATGENAICFNCRDADIILGAVGILAADAMLGELTPAMARAVADSPAVKLLVPMNRCSIRVAGTQNRPIEELVADAVQQAAVLVHGEKA